MLALFLTVVCFGFILCFSKEFTALIKKIMSVPGLTILLPLLLASWVLELYEDWGLWLLVQAQLLLHEAIFQVSSWMPFGAKKVLFLRIIVLFLVAIIPLWFYQCKIKFSKQPMPIPRATPYRIGFVFWIVATMLIVVAI